MFELQGDLSKMITNKNYNVDLPNSQDKKIIYVFAKEIYFDGKTWGNKSTRDESPIGLLKTPGIMISASGFSSCHKKVFFKNKILSSDPNELCDRLKLLIREKQGGNTFDIINKENVAMADKPWEPNFISLKHHKIFLLKNLK